MRATHPLKFLFLALAFALAVSVASPPAPGGSPEPPAFEPEAAKPALDPAKVAGDPKLRDLDALNQRRSANNLKEIALAAHNYHDVHNRFPDDIRDPAGKPLLSWRVLLLPDLKQGALFREFRLTEPWDSANNKKLIPRMPEVFRSPRVTLKSASHTPYQVFTGPDAVFGRRAPVRLANITDGTSNTIMAVESSSAVVWTRPGDMPFDRAKPLPAFGKAFGNRPLAVLMDGSTRFLDLNRIKPATLMNAIDPADGNVLGADWSD